MLGLWSLLSPIPSMFPSHFRVSFLLSISTWLSPWCLCLLCSYPRVWFFQDAVAHQVFSKRWVAGRSGLCKLPQPSLLEWEVKLLPDPLEILGVMKQCRGKKEEVKFPLLYPASPEELWKCLSLLPSPLYWKQSWRQQKISGHLTQFSASHMDFVTFLYVMSKWLKQDISLARVFFVVVQCNNVSLLHYLEVILFY